MGFDDLSEPQKQVYEFIRSKIDSRGYGPTVREIGNAFDIKSPSGVMSHLKALEKHGLIRRDPSWPMVSRPSGEAQSPWSQVQELEQQIDRLKMEAEERAQSIKEIKEQQYCPECLAAAHRLVLALPALRSRSPKREGPAFIETGVDHNT